MMSSSTEYLLYIIIFICTCTAGTATSFMLSAIVSDSSSLDEAFMRNGYNHFFIGNHVFQSEISRIMNNFCSTSIAIFCSQTGQFITNDLHLQFFACKNSAQLFNQLNDFTIFLLNLLALKTCKSLQTHFKNCFGLNF